MLFLMEILMYGEEFWWLYWKYYTLMGPTLGLYEIIMIKWKILNWDRYSYHYSKSSIRIRPNIAQTGEKDKLQKKGNEGDPSRSRLC